MTDRLDGRIALVTGGAGALGRHVVAHFLDVGASVHIPAYEDDEADDLRSFLNERSAAARLHPEADLTRPEVVARIFNAVEEADGRSPDVLLNLAGGFHMATVDDTDPDAWDRMIQMNATTAFLCSRAAFPGMRERAWGRIVNVSALPALEGGQAGLSAYGAAKAAVLNLTRSLSREGAPHGITVNAVLPSIIDTPANREAMPGADTSAWIPPSEIADVLHFLASDQARVVNGAALTLKLD